MVGPSFTLGGLTIEWATSCPRSLATRADIVGILGLQEQNLLGRQSAVAPQISGLKPSWTLSPGRTMMWDNLDFGSRHGHRGLAAEPCFDTRDLKEAKALLNELAS